MKMKSLALEARLCFQWRPWHPLNAVQMGM